jgi:hypothetical protein
MADIFNYCPDKIQCLIGGLLPVSGFVDGTFISITKDVMPFTSVKTPDGTMARLYNSDQTYTITLTLHCGSPSNDVLTKFWQLDELTQRGKFSLLIKDPSGSDLFYSATTWIETLPTLSKSASIDNRVWGLKSSSAIINIGSNSDPSSILQDLINLATGALPALEGLINV